MMRTHIYDSWVSFIVKTILFWPSILSELKHLISSRKRNQPRFR